jgi:2-oxoglutarate dehydrogenase E2 component (dihydrolipoamide succinyltransferase)
MDQSVVEIATDKVDSEIPAPVAGVLLKILCGEGDTVAVGTAIAIIGEAGEQPNLPSTPDTEPAATSEPAAAPVTEEVSTPEPVPPEPTPKSVIETADTIASAAPSASAVPSDTPRFHKGRFFSPLVRKIADEENVTIQELERLSGNGQNGRVTKKDILAYVKTRGVPQTNATGAVATTQPGPQLTEPAQATTPDTAQPTLSVRSGEDEIIEMDRMRKLIADHMVKSKHTSPHVTSFVEADVSTMVQWRNSIKDDFLDREGEKITFTPIFVEAVSKAIRDFPMINVTVDGTNIVVKKNINIGMAVALPSGNLIVPVIKNADRMNLYGIAKAVNDMAKRSRDNKLEPDDTQNGTFTLTNVGSFGNVMGTPIINQPQVAILATGIIQKKPVVIETPDGDTIGIRHMMFLSLSYDHRVVDGALGGRFLRKVADYLEQFDLNREI